jgi:hypothetical protein
MKASPRPLDPAAAPAQASLRDDRRARALLQRAQGALQKWPEGFTGFRARLTVAAEGLEHAGWATVRAGGAVDVDVADDGSRNWLGTFLAEIVAERTPSFFKDGDGRFPITFDEAARDPGEEWLLVHHGPAAPLRYRLDARGRLCQREESGAAGHHVRTYEAFVRATPGRVLPVRRSTVIYEAGRIVRSELVEDAHCCVRHAWLPAGRRLHVSHLDATTLRWARLEDHALL